MEPEDIRDLTDYTLKESWEVSNCSSLLPSTFPEEEEVTKDENDDWSVLCQVTAHSILAYYENYIHKTPCRTSIRAGHKFIEEILSGSGIRCYQAFRLTKPVFLDLCYELTHKLLQEIFNHSGETISRHFHRVLKAIGKFANDIIAPHPEYNEGKGYHKPQHQ
ncbi:hypothetical protein ACS0TY_010594 [Phlomoides rotata]